MILTDVEILAAINKYDSGLQDRVFASDIRIAEAEHVATLKAVGDALLKLETLQQFHKARIELHEGRMPEVKE